MFQKSDDLAGAKRRQLHPTITAGRDSPPDDRSPSYPISCAKATCHHHGLVGGQPWDSVQPDIVPYGAMNDILRTKLLRKLKSRCVVGLRILSA